MNDLPLEIIAHIIKQADLVTRMKLLLVNKLIGNEAKRQLQFIPLHFVPTQHDEKRVERIEKYDIRIEKYYKIDEGKEYLYQVRWFKNEPENIIHRENGPAIVGWQPSGIISYEGWFVNEKAHRLNGASPKRRK